MCRKGIYNLFIIFANSHGGMAAWLRSCPTFSIFTQSIRMLLFLQMQKFLRNNIMLINFMKKCFTFLLISNAIEYLLKDCNLQIKKKKEDK